MRPFQETVGVCPKCRKGHFHKQSGFHLFGIGNFHCDICGWDFRDPIIDEMRTSSHIDDRTYKNENKAQGFSLFTIQPKKQGGRIRKRNKIRLF